jgi:hypothetical protein
VDACAEAANPGCARGFAAASATDPSRIATLRQLQQIEFEVLLEHLTAGS